MTKADEAWKYFEVCHDEAFKRIADCEQQEADIKKIREERRGMIAQDKSELTWCLNELRSYVKTFEFRCSFNTDEGEIKAERIKRRLLEELNDLTIYVGNWN